MRLSTLLAALLLFAGANLFSQSNLSYCGTTEDVPWLREYQRNPGIHPRSNETLFVPITVHIVGTDEGSGYADLVQVLEAFCLLNEDFEPVNVQFYMNGNFRFIDDSDYYDHSFTTGRFMMTKNNVPNTINAYIVDNPAGACGYSFYDRGISLSKSCIGSGDHTWAHEIGHYLSLPHTFRGWEGYEHEYDSIAPFEIEGVLVEKADSSNCAEAGDGFCDTPADYLNDRWSCNNDGLSQTLQMDPDSVEFRSHGKYIMSYSNDGCQSIFSDEQIDAMRANLNGPRANLPTQPTDPALAAPDAAEMSLLLPENGAKTDFYDEVTLQWSSVEGADYYLVQLNQTPFFNGVIAQYATADTSLLVEDVLNSNRTYYWRVRPVNTRRLCSPSWTGEFRFRAGTLTPVTDPTLDAGVSIFPNPSGNGQLTLSVSGISEAAPLQWQLVTTAGQVVARGTEAVRGDLSRALDLRHLPGGMYLMKIQMGERLLTRKVVLY